MRAAQAPTSPRALTRTVCSQICSFFPSRITNALESAADELTAISSIDDIHEADDDDTLNQEVATIREAAGRAANDFCKKLTADTERGLLFTEESAGPASDPSAKKTRRQFSAPGFEVSLLSDDELELSVTTSTVASRFERRNREGLERAIQAVSQGHGEERAERLRALLGVFAFVNRFSSLLSGMALSISTRSRLMNAFQFHVLEELGDFYLPLARSLEGAPAHRQKAPPHHSSHPPPTGLSGWVQLMNQGRQPAADGQPGGDGYSPAAGAAATGQPGGSGGVSRGSPGAQGDGGGISHDEFVACLDRLPNMYPGVPGTPANDSTTLYEQVVGGLQQNGVSATQMPAMDLDVLRLVSLFFETFLGDDDLPASLRFLVGRLQLPVLRLALADGSFFDDDDHPARQLIQTLCQIGVGWSSDLAWVERSPVFKEVSELMDEILNHPHPDAAVFEEADDRLEALHSARLEKADRVEGRVVELEVGRAKLRAAKLVVQDVLNEYLSRHRNLKPLKWFFADAWSKVLVFTCLRHGSETDEWRSAVHICGELAEVLMPSASREEWKQRFAQVPNLLERLETRMVEAGFTSSAVDQSIEGVYAEIDKIRESEDDWFASAGEMLVEQQEDVEPITLIPAPSPGEAGGHVQLPDWVEAGTWVRIRDAEDPGRYHQVKIAAKVADTREILLVDERGARWGIWSEQEFAAALEEERVTSAAHEDVVQRTLDAMIAQLTRDMPSESRSSLSTG